MVRWPSSATHSKTVSAVTGCRLRGVRCSCIDLPWPSSTICRSEPGGLLLDRPAPDSASLRYTAGDQAVLTPFRKRLGCTVHRLTSWASKRSNKKCDLLSVPYKSSDSRVKPQMLLDQPLAFSFYLWPETVPSDKLLVRWSQSMVPLGFNSENV